MRCLQPSGNVLFFAKKDVTSVSLAQGSTAKVRFMLKSPVPQSELMVQCLQATLVELSEVISQTVEAADKSSGDA